MRLLRLPSHWLKSSRGCAWSDPAGRRRIIRLSPWLALKRAEHVAAVVEAPVEVLRTRIGKRAAAKSGASEADLAVLDHQLETAAPVGGDKTTICVDTSLDIDFERLVSAILARRSR